MTGSAGFLEFFILEASDYVEQLDGLVLRAGANGVDSASLQRLARALRGTATMAKLPSFAELAAAVERVGRALQDGALRWDQSLSGAVVAAIDELKTLLHAARTWSPAEDQRALARSAELSRYAPIRPAAAPQAPAQAATPAATFLATETANIAAGLELLSTRNGDAETASNVLRRVRALRGVAGVKEVAPLAEVLEATEGAARGLEDGREPIRPEARQLLEAAASYMRVLSSALRSGGATADVGAPSAAREAFLAAQEAWSAASAAQDHERVVPIAELFYADGGPGVVEQSPTPPTSAAERFRLELVSLSEHLRQVVDAARRAEPGGRQSDLRHALRALQAAAQSFGEREIADFIGGHLEGTSPVDRLDFLELASLDDLAAVLADPGPEAERLRGRLRDIAGGREITSAIGAGFAVEVPERSPLTPLTPLTPLMPPAPTGGAPSQPSAAPTERPAPAPSPPAPVPAQSLEPASAALIDSSIQALDALETHRFAEPAHIPEDVLVPIDALLYRGRSALDRAVEIRDDLRRRDVVPDHAALEELFDLLELARAE